MVFLLSNTVEILTITFHIAEAKHFRFELKNLRVSECTSIFISEFPLSVVRWKIEKPL